MIQSRESPTYQQQTLFKKTNSDTLYNSNQFLHIFFAKEFKQVILRAFEISKIGSHKKVFRNVQGSP